MSYFIGPPGTPPRETWFYWVGLTLWYALGISLIWVFVEWVLP